MSSLHQRLVDAITAKLATVTTANGYFTDVGSAVLVHFPVEQQQNILPSVSFADTTSTWDFLNGMTYARRLTCEIVGVVAAGTATGVRAREVEADLVAALWNDGDRTWGGLCEYSEITESELLVAQREQAIGGARCSLEITFHHLVRNANLS